MPRHRAPERLSALVALLLVVAGGGWAADGPASLPASGARRGCLAEFGAAEAVALLRRGERAERTAAYSGVKVIRADRRGSGAGKEEHGARRPATGPGSAYERSARVWHGGPRQTRIEFIRSDGRPAPVVVENESGCWFYSPRRRTWRPISWRAPEPRLDLMLRNYRIVPGRLDRVAGRLALQVRIEPRSPGNPRKHSWLDLATGIALRSDLYDSTGRLVSTTEFRHFRREPCLPPSLFQVPTKAACVDDERRDQDRLSFEPALPRWLPRGYVLDRVSRRRRGSLEVVRARYTDGLNVLSLVQWRGGQDPGDRGGDRFWGPGERLRITVGPLSITLAGDLNPAQLRRIAASIRPPRPAEDSLLTRK